MVTNRFKSAAGGLLVLAFAGLLLAPSVRAQDKGDADKICAQILAKSLVDELKSAGVSIAGDVSEHPWGKIATFLDPDGNELQLYEGSE